MLRSGSIKGIVPAVGPFVAAMILGATVAIAQGPPQGPPTVATVLDVGTYCDITLGMWQKNTDVFDRKIRQLDALYQMPDSFRVMERKLNQELQAWQDSVMVAYQTDVETYLKYGVTNRHVIERMMEQEAYQTKLDALRKRHEGLDAAYRQRLLGYNIPRN